MERLKNVAVVVGLILSAVTLFNWGSQFFSHALTARLESGAFAFPPQLDSFYNKLSTTLDPEKLRARILSDSSFKELYSLRDLSELQRETIVRGALSILPASSDITVPFTFRNLEAYWDGSVTNSSKATVTSVQLYVRSARFALLKRDDNSTASQTVENLITIGDLRPGETVKVSIWSNSGFRPWSGNDDVRLTHSSGIGTVTIPRSVTGLAALVDKYDFVVYGALFGLFFFLVVPLAIERFLLLRSRRRTT